jgi:dTDP-4-dehydrorhamnose reductase
MDILVTGGTGQVGLELRRRAWPAGTRPFFPSRDELDLTDAARIASIIASRPWKAVINAAAYTAVDAAEDDVGAAWTLNALAPAVLAAETARANIPLVHISTDYVFSGAKTAPYVEDDQVGPLCVYGASKEAGEQAVRTANPRHVILRTSWIVSGHRANFLKTMLRLAMERSRFNVVADQYGCPTSARDLSDALAKIALRLARDTPAPIGTFHLANFGETSWHGLATEIIRVAFKERQGAPIIAPIAAADYPSRARRPANSRLATDKIAQAYGIALRSWQEATAEIVEALVDRIGPGTEARRAK